MKANRHADGERTLAVFFDFENIGIGLNLRRDRFDIVKVVERLVEKGKLVVKKAYADWSRFAQYTAPLHEAAIELIEIPRRGQTGKNSADIRLCVDAMDLAYSKDHIDTFVIVSGDSDFSPLVSKLKELGRHVIGLGLAEATSDLLRDNCDEFIYYDDLDRATEAVPGLPAQMPEAKKKVFGLLLESLLALRRENKEVLFSSMVKDTMKRKKPSFNEEYHGYRTFSELLEDAAAQGLIDIERHKGSGTYVVTRFGSEPKAMPVPAPAGERSARLTRPQPQPQADGRGAGDARRGADRPPAAASSRGPARTPAAPGRKPAAPSRSPAAPGRKPAAPSRKPAPAAAAPVPATVPDAPDDLLDLVEDRYGDE